MFTVPMAFKPITPLEKKKQHQLIFQIYNQVEFIGGGSNMKEARAILAAPSVVSTTYIAMWVTLKLPTLPSPPRLLLRNFPIPTPPQIAQKPSQINNKQAQHNLILPQYDHNHLRISYQNL
ncbi:hypothetical protein LIER_29264 [Lithospermum erythrorhizon]|uniref:Uncharacterized protein n=1 Tax=Lithospermum erythrorhizon TaxID=34254 RepID=A0AAV3RM79_LITER